LRDKGFNVEHGFVMSFYVDEISGAFGFGDEGGFFVQRWGWGCLDGIGCGDGDGGDIGEVFAREGSFVGTSGVEVTHFFSVAGFVVLEPGVRVFLVIGFVRVVIYVDLPGVEFKILWRPLNVFQVHVEIE
jgi:hypothetical protein